MYFLCGVADVELYKGDALLAKSQTLIDSSISVGVTAEDIRAGQGAKLYGKYFHSSTFDVTLNDQQWDIDYIARNTGSQITVGGNAADFESVTLGEGGVGEITKTPAAFGVNGEYGTIGWAAVAGTEDYQKVTFDGKQFTIPGGEAGQVYCVKYFYANDAAKMVRINANFIPDTVTCIMTATLYSGDASNPTAGTKAGKLQITIPRLILSGAQEITMNMTGVSSTSLSGSALATANTASCEGEGYYAEILEIIEGANWYDGLIGLVVADADFTLTTEDTRTLLVKGIYENAVPKTIANDKLTFTSTTAATATVGEHTGIVTPVAEGTTTITINVTDKPEIEAVAYCTIANE